MSARKKQPTQRTLEHRTLSMGARPKKKTPTARTLEHLKQNGITAGVVEKWITIPNHPGGGIRRDLFGAIDIIALDRGIVGIQCTSWSNHAAHLTKMSTIPELIQWIESGGRLELWSWRKKGSNWEHRVDRLAVKEKVTTGNVERLRGIPEAGDIVFSEGLI